MKNRDMPANPLVNENGSPHHYSDIAFNNRDGVCGGLTKLEYAAIQIMAADCGNPHQKVIDMDYESLAFHSVRRANALFDELEKQENE